MVKDVFVDLILWRHAQAHEARPGQSDLDRALTARGQMQADVVGRWLNARLPQSTRILVSPAVRTCATAAALNRPWKVAPDLAPDGPMDGVLAASGWPHGLEGSCTSLIVGHQPMLGQVVARLLGMSESHCSVRKGAVWWLRRRVRDERAEVVLMTVLHPDWMLP